MRGTRQLGLAVWLFGCGPTIDTDSGSGMDDAADPSTDPGASDAEAGSQGPTSTTSTTTTSTTAATTLPPGDTGDDLPKLDVPPPDLGEPAQPLECCAPGGCAGGACVQGMCTAYCEDPADCPPLPSGPTAIGCVAPSGDLPGPFRGPYCAYACNPGGGCPEGFTCTDDSLCIATECQ